MTQARKLFLSLLCLAIGHVLVAQTTYTTVSVGEWSSPSVWSGGNVPPEPIPAGDIVNVTNTVVTDFTAQITNNGTMNVTDNGMIEMRSSTVLTNNGDINGSSSAFAVLWIRSSSTVINNGTITIQEALGSNPAFRIAGGDMTNKTGATLDFINVLMTVSSANSLFTNEEGAQLILGEDTQFNLFSFSSNDIVVSNAGTITTDGQIFFSEGAQENLSTGVINLNGNPFGQLTIGNIFNNDGIVNINSAVNTQRIVDIYSDAVINSANGTINLNSGYFRGSGTLIKPTLTNDAIFIPFGVDGSGDNFFNLTGNYDGTGEFRVFPRDPATTTTGKLEATGTVDISQQSLNAFFASGLSNPAIGTTIPIISAGGGVMGTFTSEGLPFISDPGKEWKVEYGADFVNLVVVVTGEDLDNDGIPDGDDNCPTTANADQADYDQDGEGDVCDDDDDNDGISDADEIACGSDPLNMGSTCEICDGADNDLDGDTDEGYADSDDDGLADCVDDCPLDADNDSDGDGVCGDVDNCPSIANADQADNDEDGEGDVCDADDDNDGCLDDDDASPLVASGDADCDGVGDDCDVCPGGDDSVDNNNDGLPDCAYPPSFEDILDAWKCSNNANNVKVLICHIPPGNPANAHTICVSEKQAQKTHLDKHGDYLGPCTSCTIPLIGRPDETLTVGRVEHLGMTVFPNPANDQITIRLKEMGTTSKQINIYNNLGSLVWKGQIGPGQSSLQVDLGSNRFQSGVYTVVTKYEGEVFTEKLVINK